MLGFSTYSQTTFSESSVALTALAFVGAAVSVGQVTATGFDAQAEVASGSVQAVTTTVDLEKAYGQAVTNLDDVFTTSFVEALQDVNGQASATSNSVSAVFTANTLDTIALANVTFSSILLDVSLEPIEYDAEANFYITSAALSSVLSDYYAVEGGATASLFNVSANFEANIETPTAVRFSFDPDIYSRNRTAYITTYGSNPVVYVTKVQGNNTVYITA